MKALSAAVAAVALIAAGSALAAGGEDLVKKDGCMACHDVNTKKIGPSFKEIAAKTKGDVKVVTEAIEKGAKTGQYEGVKMAMPPQAKAKGDAAAIAKWIASLK
jgi:cytochrome c